MSPRASWSITSAYGGGWCVTVAVGSHSLSRFFGERGGEWELNDGIQGRQLVGTCDVHAPRNEERFGRWVRRYLSREVADMRTEASYDAQVPS